MAKYPWIRQQSGEDCAAVSLAIVARHYGRTLRISTVREAIGTGRGGTTLAGLTEGARRLGFTAKAIQAAPGFLDHLDEAPLPAILYWKGYHFVVLFGRDGDRFVLSDPALGVRKVTRRDVEEAWEGGMAILLSPHPIRFPRQTGDPASPFEHLVRRLWTQRRRLAPVAVFGGLLGAASMAAPFALQEVALRLGLPGRDEERWRVMASLLGLALLYGALSWVRSSLASGFTARLRQSLKGEFGGQLLHLPLAYHESRGASLIRYRLDDIDGIAAIISHMVTDFPLQALTAVGAMVIMGLLYPQVLAVSLALALVSALLSAFLRPRVREAGYRLASLAGETYFLLSQFLAAALMVKSVGATSRLEEELHGKLLLEDSGGRAETSTIRLAFLPGSLLRTVAPVVVIWMAAEALDRQLADPYLLIAPVGLAVILFDALESVTASALGFTEFRTTAEVFEESFEAIPEGQSAGRTPWKALPPTGDLSLEGVAFQYPGRRPLFQDLGLRVPGGRVSALVGPSGSGKSTIAYLITRLHDLQGGAIVLAGTDLKDVPLECLRRQIVLVPQEARFLTRSVLDNLRLGAPRATEAEMEEACRVTEAHAFIDALPEGYDTILGDFSANLSAGEGQRIALARAILLDPPVLILDESTGSLDPPTEAKVLDNLLGRRHGRTTILISHRPRVIERAEWVVFLDGGRTRFQGPIDSFRREPPEALAFLVP
jgi:ATP-binding cassette, subfamily C, bacterial